MDDSTRRREFADGSPRRSFLGRIGSVGAIVLAGGVSLVGSLSGCLTAPRRDGDPAVVREGFETDLSGWTPRGHVGPDASTPFDWEVAPTGERSRSGERSLSVFTAGNHDDGTAWVATSLPVDPGARYRARGSAYFYSEQESFNVVRHAVAYLGPAEPTVEEDFPAPGENSSDGGTAVGGLREPLDQAAGWNEYAFEWDSTVDADRLHFAVGVSVVWETDRTDFVDDVAVTLERV